MESVQRRVPGAGKRQMTWGTLLSDRAEIDKMLNVSIQSLSTIHYPLITIHLATPPLHTTRRLILGETEVFLARGGDVASR